MIFLYFILLNLVDMQNLHYLFVWTKHTIILDDFPHAFAMYGVKIACWAGIFYEVLK